MECQAKQQEHLKLFVRVASKFCEEPQAQSPNILDLDSKYIAPIPDTLSWPTCQREVSGWAAKWECLELEIQQIQSDSKSNKPKSNQNLNITLYDRIRIPWIEITY